MKSNGSLLYSLILVVGDFLALVLAFVSAYVLRVSINITDRPITEPVQAVTYLQIFLVLLPFWILIFALLGLYNISIYEKRFSEFGRLLIGSFVGLLFVIGYAYAVDRPIFPARMVPIFGFTLAFLFLVLFRNLARAFRTLLFRYDIGITNILIVGNTKIADELADSLSDSRISGYRIIGLVGSREHSAKRFPGLRVFKSFEDAVKNLKASEIHSIVQTELYAAGTQNNEILDFAQTNHIAYRFIPGNSELFVGNIDVELFRSSIPVIAVHQTALIGWGRVVKRVSDIVIGGLFLLIALPIMLILAILVKIFEPRNKVFYQDARLTRFRTPIKVFKFRTIKQQYSGLSPEEAFQKMGKPELVRQYRENGDQLDNDPRVSKVGRFLRRSSLDELPQLINVVKGDISFVGPRALHPAELEHFDKKDLILTIKSGLTGLAQISGRRNISFEERRKLDLYYVQNWSLWLDLIILVKTIRVVIQRSGAR